MFQSKFRQYKQWNSFTVGFSNEFHRVVNQKEIADYFRHNPGRTETEMQWELYNYDRRTSTVSNKKYAVRLRKALSSGKLSRIQVQKGNRKVFIYYVKV